jgi:DNA-binding transcriptional LysR family regulator
MLRFTLRQLSYFVAAGETGSVTLAAEKVRISQPSVSAAISQLEAAFNVQLFVRHHAQGLSLTSEGERILRAAKALLQQAIDLQHLAGEVAQSISGPVNVGTFRTYAPLVIPELCRSFLEVHPQVQLRVLEGDEAALLAMLRRSEISVALTYSLNVPEDVAFEPLAELPSYALLPADHRLAGRGSLALSELADEPFVLLDMPLTREYFLSLFLREGLEPKIFARSEAPETVRSYVASGLGFSLSTVRPINKRALNGKPLTYVPLAGAFRPMVLGLATLGGVRTTRAVQAFVDHCRANVSTDHLPGMAPLGEG